MLKSETYTLGYSPWGNGHSIFPFDDIFKYSIDCKTDGFELVDAFVLWGGTDIHPSLYNEGPSKYSQAPTLPSERDIWEWKALQYCKANSIPVIGVCRGAQMMCAFAGGKLIQHCTGHTGGNHAVQTEDGEKFSVTSAHHQMLDLEGTKHELLAWTPTRLSQFYYGSEAKAPSHIVESIARGTFKEPEVVYFPEFNGLAIQGHPEWSHKNNRFVEYCNEQIVNRLLTETEVWQ